MDLEKPERITYPHWAGLIFGFLLPGSAHYMSGHKTSGLRWYIVLFSLTTASGLLIASSHTYAIAAGMITALVAFTGGITVVIRSYRPVKRLRFKGWLAFLALALVNAMLPEPARFFSISSSSMQPTLRGVTAKHSDETISFIDTMLRGKVREEFKAKASGVVEGRLRRDGSGITFTIDGEEHRLPHYAFDPFLMTDAITEGDILWSGVITARDNLVVNPYAYILKDPQRGDIVVFSTEGLDSPHIKSVHNYVKRVIAVPGDSLRIDPPDLVVNGRRLNEPEIFNQLAYSNTGMLSSTTNKIKLGKDEYFLLGDNNTPGTSFDSRHFGPILLENIIGKVKTIYWPLDRIGPVH